jgi:UDP-glucuronate decarboxylase
MVELAELTLKLVGGRSKIVHKTSSIRRPETAPAGHCARAAYQVGAQGAVEEGLKRTIAYFKKRL